jgi:hypothetical protein
MLEGSETFISTTLARLILALVVFFLYSVENLEWHEHEDGGWLIRLPGFAYDDFSRTG